MNPYNKNMFKLAVNACIVFLLFNYKYEISNTDSYSENLMAQASKSYYGNNATNEQLETLIVIPSLATASEKEYRKFIRETWKKTLPIHTKLIFFIGTKSLYSWDISDINSEMELHHDIVKMNIKETYVGLSDKMAEIYLWICLARKKGLFPSVKWIFKTDTDVWFNPTGFFETIKGIPDSKTWVGSMNTEAPVLRRGPWANTLYTSNMYPHYNAGAGYALSLDLVLWIGENYEKGFLKIMPNEDAMIGIWIAGLNVKIIDTPFILPQIGRHGKKLDAPYNQRCSEKVFLIHNMSLRGLKNSYVRYQKCRTTCQNKCPITEEDVLEYFK
eukprot:NODE_804_length_4102_cov_0.255309.p1 type:complete len:329 gc:universal NODE_804_length_4102_cov_0.255309:1778-792(-)